ncbi:putative mitochondrial protein, partial [Drosera capensis]
DSNHFWESFDLRVLEEDTSETQGESSTSVNKPEGQPFPRANPIGEEAGPSNRAPAVRPYPFAYDEVIGGESIRTLHYRLMEAAQKGEEGSEIPLFTYQLTRYEAEDLFDVKVSIIRQMAPLDPEGDWDRRRAQALANARTATGEEPLERLHAMKADLETNGVQSNTYLLLKNRVFHRTNEDRHSET